MTKLKIFFEFIKKLYNFNKAGKAKVNLPAASYWEIQHDLGRQFKMSHNVCVCVCVKFISFNISGFEVPGTCTFLKFPRLVLSAVC